jgi:hypothetical protein
VRKLKHLICSDSNEDEKEELNQPDYNGDENQLQERKRETVLLSDNQKIDLQSRIRMLFNPIVLYELILPI